MDPKRLRNFIANILSTLFLRAGLISILLSLSFLNPVLAAEITLAWDANTETDLAGYKLYYENENDSLPYQGTDANEGASPIIINEGDLTNPSSPSFTLTGLKDGQFYYFALTAFSSDGMESDFSDQIGVLTEPSDGSGSSDNSGGGCFISSALSD